MLTLNNKIKNGRTELISDAQMVGNYAYDSTSDRLRRLTSNTNGALNVDIHGGATGSGDLKARTDIADPNTSTFIKCNADGTLEMTAELSSAGLATSAIQTDGTQRAKSMGSEDGTPTGSQKQLRVDGNGRLSVDINSGIPTKTDGTTGHSPATGIGLIGFDSGTARALACDNQGHLQVDVLNQDRESQLAAFTNINDVSSVKRLLCDSDGHLQVDIVSGGGGGSSLSFLTSTMVNNPTVIADTFSAEGVQDLGNPANSVPKEFYISVSQSGTPRNCSVSIEISVDNTTFFPVPFATPKTTVSSSDLFGSKDIVGDDFNFPRYVKFKITNNDGAGNDATVGLVINYYQ